MRRFLERIPLLDLRAYRAGYLPGDVMAAVAVAFMAVPQGVAYAIIAGLPPAVGLYACAVPTLVGALVRSSRHVVTGPTNALSLLVGGAIVAEAGVADPMTVAVTLALLVGVIQAAAGTLRLGAMVDYVSSPVVVGYVSGAGVLIGVGQLHLLTATPSPGGRLFDRLLVWSGDLPDAHGPSVALGLGTVAFLLVLRRVNRRIPGALVGMAGAILLNFALGLEQRGMHVVADLAPVPAGLPPISTPDLALAGDLVPFAVACTVLSLVESSAVARSLSMRTGQRLQPSWEFLGQGLANVAAAFFSAYPTSGSLTRSAFNLDAGARSRLAAALTGALMLLVLVVFGPVVNHTPLPALAGLLLVIAFDLVDVGRIRRILGSGRADAMALAATALGTWFLPLDQAIYLGVGISLVTFLRSARMLVIRELVVDRTGQLTEVLQGERRPRTERCDHVRVLQLEGPLFFGAAGELLTALDDAIRDRDVRVLIVRLKRTQGFDATVAAAFENISETLRSQGRRLLLVGMRRDQMAQLQRTGMPERLGTGNLYPTEPGWFVAMEKAVEHALTLVESEGHRADCPLMRHHMEWRRSVDELRPEPEEADEAAASSPA